MEEGFFHFGFFIAGQLLSIREFIPGILYSLPCKKQQLVLSLLQTQVDFFFLRGLTWHFQVFFIAFVVLLLFTSFMHSNKIKLFFTACCCCSQLLTCTGIFKLINQKSRIFIYLFMSPGCEKCIPSVMTCGLNGNKSNKFEFQRRFIFKTPTQ